MSAEQVTGTERRMTSDCAAADLPITRADVVECPRCGALVWNRPDAQTKHQGSHARAA